MMEKTTSKRTKASNKNLFIALAVAVTLLVVVIVGILMFLQSPERQLANGFANLVKSDKIGVNGTINATSSNGSYETKIDAKTNKQVAEANLEFKYSGTNNGAKLSGETQVVVGDDGALYAKLDQPKKFMESFVDSFIKATVAGINANTLTPEQQAMALAPMRTTFVDAGQKMEGKWLKISQPELRVLLGGGTETNSDCYVQFSRELETNIGARNELASAYTKHQFMRIDDGLESEGTSKGYRVSIDQAKLKEFKDSVKDNAAVKKLGSCGQDILTLGAADNLNNQSVDIWVDRFSSNITRIKYERVNSDGNSTVDLRFSYGVSVNAATPSDSINLDSVLPSLIPAR
jgi:hypothetical protein